MSLALVFPGQGAQVVGMGMELAQKFPVARNILDQADDILGMSLSDIIANGPMEDLTRTDISQPAILVMSWMAHEVVNKVVENFSCKATAGLSLGEYTPCLPPMPWILPMPCVWCACAARPCKTPLICSQAAWWP